MSKKKRWFSKEQSLFPNSVAQHSKALTKTRAVDEDGFYIDEEEYGYSSYAWDLDRKLLNRDIEITGNKKEDRKNSYELTKSEYDYSYSSYQKTGVWGGYYRQPQLTYKYVQQMANALSAAHNIKVEIGDTWKVDLIGKTLTYNPASLIYGTKAELLATLMHEIGKLRYVTHSSRLQNKYISMYEQPALEVLSIYEDLRTDFLMLKAYEGASEIYESVIPTIEKQVADYMKFGKSFKDLIVKIPQSIFQDIMYQHTSNMPDKLVHEDDAMLKEQLFRHFGTSELKKVEKGLIVLQQNILNKGTIYEYCGEMLSVMYDLDEQPHKKFENIQEKVGLTVDTIETSKKSKNSQELVDYLDKVTYPVVEDLLREAKEKTDEIEKAFPEMSKQTLNDIKNKIEYHMSNRGGQGVNVDPSGNVKTRSSGQSNRTIPPEWESGDYKTLKDSVSMEIRQLVNRLTFIRREELTVRYEADQKRGKLNSRKLYKSSTGSRRLFKKKLENTDTIQSFAFSVLLDVSGSMSGSRITHCTRALIIFSEVFKKMNIPFELVTFSDGAKTIKSFSADLDKSMEKKIGGLVRANGGGTNMDRGLDKLEIHRQSEKNKVVIVLTDGGVGGASFFDERYFIPWQKKGIKSVGFGVECEEEMARLCQGNSKVLKNASQLPIEFSNLLKQLIKR